MAFLSRRLTALLTSLWIGLTPALALAQAPKEKSLLWEISGNGLGRPSYLFGTIHSGCVSQLVLSAQHQRAIAQVDQLYLEVDMDEFTTYIGAVALMLMPGNQGLRDVLTPTQYRKVQKFFEGKRGIPLWTLAKIRPFYLAGMIDTRKQTCTNTSRESILMQAAKKRNLEIYGLETPEDLIDVQNSIPMSDEIAILMEAIEATPGQLNEVEMRLRRLYNDQDVDGMYQMIAGDPTKTTSERKLWEALLDRRNRQWLPNIQQAMAAKPTFFGVGAGHLGGDQGVISLLRQAGYTVRPIMEAKPNTKVR
jgi:uncharacterized protein